jgi:DNA-directed RNA polymerase III subunit RPC1
MSDKGKICETCNKTQEFCPGHFGYVQLELPVFHVGFFKQTVNIL